MVLLLDKTCPKCKATRFAGVRNCSPCAVGRARRAVARDPAKQRQAVRKSEARRAARDPEWQSRRNRERRAYKRSHEQLPAQKERHRANQAKRRAKSTVRIDPAVVYRQSHGMCGICHLPVAEANFHVDHIMPLARGGEHSYENAQAAHPLCNMRKGARG